LAEVMKRYCYLCLWL